MFPIKKIKLLKNFNIMKKFNNLLFKIKIPLYIFIINSNKMFLFTLYFTKNKKTFKNIFSFKIKKSIIIKNKSFWLSINEKGANIFYLFLFVLYFKKQIFFSINLFIKDNFLFLGFLNKEYILKTIKQRNKLHP